MTDQLQFFGGQDPEAPPLKALSAKELTAINWYMKDRNLRLKLSTPPTIYFSNRDDGREQTVDISVMIDAYNEWNEADKKQRAKQRRAEAEFQKRLKAGRIQ